MRHFSHRVILVIIVLHTLYVLTSSSFFESLDGSLFKVASQVRNRRSMQAGTLKSPSAGPPPKPPVIPNSFPLSAANDIKVTEDKPPTKQAAADYLQGRIEKWNRDGGEGGGYAYYPSAGGYDMAYSVILAMLAAKNQATTTVRPIASRPQNINGFTFPRPPSPSSSNNRPPATRPATSRQKVPAAALAMLLSFLRPVYG